ncbi:glycosyltransferase [Niabella drilacis]|uniref:Glycosyltransferase like family protein n=1 Tax=Niabella drilacis (strain DSM 25811 / CCM 8410 / CCUG 62505 / LMG 26954 / E90) TaxID=1285928 RepID=A0A1G7A007_NIADE|nr:glycosyltransferase [Niabella drilacis]SDE07963.1 Glycosyltransferase like family protein [Niabella drilacis]
MLSIVISSYREAFYAAIEKDIADTIGSGIIYELIQVKNPGLMGVCEAYNKGLDQSQYPYVLFLHEDLLFNTKGWGYVLLDIFKQNEKTGLVGVAGGQYKSRAPSGWWGIDDNAKYVYVRHGSKEENELMRYGFGIQTQEHLIRVLSLDGLFIALRRSTGLRFNEQLKGYHQYDLAISIDAHLKGYEAVCTDLIDITHYSMGNPDKSWVESADLFFDLYAPYLPLYITPGMTQLEKTQLEKKNYIEFIANAWNVGFDRMAWKYWWHFFWLKPFSSKPFKLLKKMRQARRVSQTSGPALH